ncbi:MAG: choice-of-anchor A family protein [Bdellovibrionales bacterium]|nr:choice-of-anchor A family protein [Bdellovibrionales bacterium]
MKTVSRFIWLLAIASAAGCAKSSNTRLEPQVDPAPSPTVSPTPHPTLGPTPIPSPSPNPNASPNPVACDPTALKEFAGVSAFAGTSAKFEGMNLSHGAVAPSITLDFVDLGYGLGRDGGRYDVVGDTVDLRDVTVENGGVAYASSIKFHEGVDVFGLVKKTTVVDYATVKARAIALRAKLLARPANGTVAMVCNGGSPCRAVLKGTDPKVNRFTLTVAQMNQLKRNSKIAVDVPKHAAAVVVLQATSLAFDDIKVDSPAETVWIVAGAGGTFKLDSLTLTGTVLAPESSVEMDSALVMGRVISDAFTSASCSGDSVCATIDSQEMPDAICL